MEVITEVTGEARSFPMCVYRREGTRYYVTNLKYLNRDAVNIIARIIRHIAEHGEEESVKYRIPQSMSRQDLKIINDIICGLNYGTGKSRGRGYLYTDTFLVRDCTLAVYNDGSRIVVYELIPQHARVIHRLAKESDTLRLEDIIVEIVKEETVRLGIAEGEDWYEQA